MSHRHLKIGFVLVSMLAMAACDRGSPDTRENRFLSNDQQIASETAAPTQIASEEACRASAEALDQMVSLSRGDLQYKPKGELIIGEAAWGELPGVYRASLAQIVAHAAACPDGDPASTVVTVRSRESGAVLAQGKYSEFAKK